MRIEFLYWEDCPSHTEALERLRQVMLEEGLPDRVELVRIASQDDAVRHGFPGSPTVRINGEDLQPEGARGGAVLTCRTYRTEDDRLSPLPTATMLRRALRAARRETQGG